MAHIGVLQWFEEHRIPIDLIVGTSMGGLVGGAYAGGLAPEEIRRLMRETDWDTMFESDSPFEDKTFRRKQDRRLYPSALEFGLKHGFSMAAGLNSGQQVAFLLDRVTLPYWDIESFDQLPTPFRSVAVDLRTSTVVVLGDGSLSQALRATMSLPAVFGPVEIGPWLLVDGGVLNNVPADVVPKPRRRCGGRGPGRGGHLCRRGDRRRRRSSPSRRAPSPRWRPRRNGSGWQPPTW